MLVFFVCVVSKNDKSDMEVEIHILEQEAYCAVLRAFKAQSDAISWVSKSLLYPFCI